MSKKILIHDKLIGNELLYGSIIFARYKEKWIFCRQKEKNTWEIPGGRLEKNDKGLFECAKRELKEETGAVKFDLFHICYYSNYIEGKQRTLGVYFAKVHSIGILPETEIDEVYYSKIFPENLSYPDVYNLLLPKLFQKIAEENYFNVYKTPTKYLRLLQKEVVIPNQKRLIGKSVIVAFFTKVCKAGCKSCFFNSKYQKNDFIEKQELSNIGFKKFIDFVNYANNGYLLISGGGEPFEKIEYIIETIKLAKTDKIVIATSAYWAKNKVKAKNTVDEMFSALSSRNDNIDLVIRVSLDRYHSERIGLSGISNLVQIFDEFYHETPHFKISIHTLFNDETINIFKERINGKKIGYCKSDIIKKNNNRYSILTPQGYIIEVEEAKLFYSNLLIDLVDLNRNEIEKAKEVFFKDVRDIQNGNFSIVTNNDGTYGLDYLVSFNGNVSTWGNYHREYGPNLYIDSPEEIINKLYNDIISYSFIDKTIDERFSIVAEVNLPAVERSATINVRDYSGVYLLEEDKTALYYGIRIVQEYLASNDLKTDDLCNMCPELYSAILQSRKVNVDNFNNSDFTIFSQLKNITDDKEIWHDTIELAKLGHYDLSYQQIKKAINSFMNLSSSKIVTNSNQQERLHNKFNPMNKNVEVLLRNSKKQKL